MARSRPDPGPVGLRGARCDRRVGRVTVGEIVRGDRCVHACATAASDVISS
jgi:hypothetical protein